MEGKEGTKELGKPTSPNEEKHSTEIKTTPDSDIGRISSDLLSQDLELQELKKELSQVNESFNTFRNDYSQLLTLYNETNDELQDLLRERSSEKTHVRSIPPDNTAELLTVQEKYRTLEIERDKYREMYLSAVESTTTQLPHVSAAPDDRTELQEQIRDMVDQMQELELVREEMALRLQQQAAEKDELMDEINHMRLKIEEVEAASLENEGNCQFFREQLSVKNAVIDKLRKEFTDLGDDNTRLRAQVSKFQESAENHEALLNSANVNNEDITKDYQALQYRCTEAERREQEHLLYIKDCVRLVEQTNHEKEQLVMLAAQSDNMRLEIEGTLGSIVEEASRRTLDEVERIKSESNKNISMLISECGKHQERVAELEAELEEKNRILEQQSVSVSRSPDSVEIADKDAVIYKLREHVNKLEEDKTNLTDQLIEVSNTMRASKEHFESKIRSLEFRASSTKEKLNRTLNENKTLLNECKNSETDIETMATEQRVLRNKLTEVQAVLAASEKQNSQQIRELQEEEARKREEIRSEHHKVIQNLRNDVVNKQNDISRLQEQQCHSTYLLSSKESELNSTISSLTKKLRDRTNLHKQALSDLEKLRSQQEADREKSFKTDSRLKAVNMQLACANNQVAMVTENEAKLCSKIKELQLKIDQLEFDMERGKTSPVTGGVLTHSGLGNIMEQPAVPLLSPKKRNKSSRKQDKKDRKEKEQISKIFSSDVIRSTKKERSRKATSTPHLEKSDTTIKFTDSNCHEDISRISEG
ncbi:hypothetical protein ACHWQZ_G001545 [Mnemiopsis leidyi]